MASMPSLAAMHATSDSGPKVFFQAQQAAFGRTLDGVLRGAGRETLVPRLLAQAYDSYEHNAAEQAQGQPPLDCGRGCAACCSLRVTATAPEILGVARFLQAVQPSLQARGIDLIGRLRQVQAQTIGLSEAERVQVRRACPFIAQGVCVIYAVRPLACRGHASHDRRSCAEAAAGRADEVAYSVAHMTVRSLVQNAMQSAMRDRGLAWSAYELLAGTVLALEHDDAEAAWWAGQDPLAAAQVHEVDPQEMAQVFDALKV